jgi:hypothetical protein
MVKTLLVGCINGQYISEVKSTPEGENPLLVCFQLLLINGWRPRRTIVTSVGHLPQMIFCLLINGWRPRRTILTSVGHLPQLMSAY